MGFFKNRVQRRVWNEYKPGPPRYTDREAKALTPEMVITFMEAADERPNEVTLAFIEECCAMLRAEGHIVRTNGILKDLRWLAKKSAKMGVRWDRVP